MKNILISSFLLLFSGIIQHTLLNKQKNENAADSLSAIVSNEDMSNQIVNASGLQSIKNKISAVDSDLVVIKVLHIGDSHLKSGYFSQPFMEKLNTYYLQKLNGKLFFNFQTFCKSGTKYSDYNGLAELDNQLLGEKYDLVVISLGTNDAFSGSARVKFYEKVDHLVNKIKTLAPQAAILLTTPPDGLKKSRSGYNVLPDLQNVVDIIVNYANDHKIAYWNLYQIMGGTNSINGWYQRKLAAADRIHFTAQGYNLFADWLFEAFSACLESKPTKTVNL
jgi:lysophospholipase L1-like esterase